MSVYGESHFYWTKDEAAVMGGPWNIPSFSESVSNSRTGSSFWGDQYYTKSYKCQISYNALLSQEYSKTVNAPVTPDPLGDLEAMNVSMIKEELKAYVDKLEAKVKAGNWTSDSLKKVQDAIAKVRKYINWDMADASDLIAAREELDNAFNNLKPETEVKRVKQTLKIKKKNKVVSRKALKKTTKIIKILKVKNAQGKVTFKLAKVSNKKYKKHFKVGKSSGKIKLKKGLKKGKYIKK